jgi:hypothetical protein
MGSPSLISAELKEKQNRKCGTGDGVVGQKAAFTSAGDRDAAKEIRYLGRVRERENKKCWSYIWSGAL